MNPIPLLLAEAPSAAPAPVGGLGSFLPLVIIFAIFYFMMIRPQQRREKERKAQVAALRAGAKVLFCGGMIGTVEEVRATSFLIRVASGATVEVVRSAVEMPLPDAPAAEGAAKGAAAGQGKE
ncbi:MAG: preprotein translocase subunit YajC [Kiritimatiellae bacterium]|nr:preprotein translocase subunit YajC [Kiritimatiellia bacterium]